MKKFSVIVVTLFSLFLVAGNAAAIDLNGNWDGYMYCSDDWGDTAEHFIVGITQVGDFINTFNYTPSYGELCGGVLDGNKISITCDDGTFSYGEIKGNKIYVINHIPQDGKTCKGVVTRYYDDLPTAPESE